MKMGKESECDYGGSNHDWNWKCEIMIGGEKVEQIKEFVDCWVLIDGNCKGASRIYVARM